MGLPSSCDNQPSCNRLNERCEEVNQDFNPRRFLRCRHDPNKDPAWRGAGRDISWIMADVLLISSMMT